MALRLRVVSDQRRTLGDMSSVVFGVGGGSIGRSADNDWVLPDALRYVSGRHARVLFRDGRYLLEDTSTNGVYVNDSERPISRQAPHPLRNGDMLRIGEYQIVVTVDSTHDAHAAASAAPELAAPPPRSANGAPPAISPTSDPTGAAKVLSASDAVLNGTHGKTGQTDIGASLNLQALLADDPSPSDSFRAVNAFGQAVPTPIKGRREAPPRRDSAELDREAEAVDKRIARLARAAAARDKPNVNGAALHDVQSGLQAFCRGAGIDPERLPAEAQTRMLHLAGQLFRESLVNLRDLERSHHQMRNRFRIEMRKEDDPTRPSLERGGVEDLVLQLLSSHDSRRVDAVQWLREAFEKVKLHEDATARANREAFVEFLKRLEPGELQARFDRALRRGKQAPTQPEYWNLYSEFYRNLSEMPEDHLPHLFVETFARIYVEAILETKNVAREAG